MRKVFLAVVACVAFAVASVPAMAQVRVDVYRSSQSMKVTVDGVVKYRWAVSTGRSDRMTPAGSFKKQWLDRYHKSSIYDDAPMPYAIFYDGNRAIHGTNETRRLGSRASHGCVRLAPGNAAALFALAKQHSMSVVVH